MRRIGIGLMCLAITAVAPAQPSVLVVDAALGPGAGFAGIDQAVAAASDGDVIMVRSGTYRTFAIDGKALTVAAAPGATVLVRDSFATTAFGVAIRNLQSHQQVLLRGLIVDWLAAAPIFPCDGVRIESCAGSVTLEGCQFRGLDAGFLQLPLPPGRGLFATASAAVTLRDTIVRGGDAYALGGGGHGATLVDSDVSFHGVTALGGFGAPDDGVVQPAGAGGDGARVEATARLFAAGSGFVGGPGGPAPQSSFPPVLCFGGDGGAGLRLVGASASAILRACTPQGGAGGSASASCPAGLPGAPIVAPPGSTMLLPQLARSLALTSPVAEGQPLLLQVAGQPLEPALLAVSPVQAGVLGASPPDWLLPGLPEATILSLGTLDAAGGIDRLVTPSLPDLGPGIQGVALYLQAAHFPPSAPPLLGMPTTIVLLDQVP